MQSFPVVALSPQGQGGANIAEGAEPVGVKAIIAQSSVELSTCPFASTGPAGIGSGRFPFLGPAQHAAPGA